ncbi:hypothetical protein KAU11_08470 [Candidatus Babeliales bacterium]|nr:hypothetical protein [Candidatus Babeliales bacterium]
MEKLKNIYEHNNDNISSDQAGRVIDTFLFDESQIMKSKRRGFCEDIEEDFGSKTLGSKNSITVDSTKGFISQLCIRFEVAGTLTVSAHNLAYAMIESYKISIGGEDFDYHGDSLFQYICTVNTDQETRDQLGNFAGDAASSSIPGICYAYLLGPGSNCVINAYNDPSKQIFFPLGKCNTDMVIEVKLKAGTEVEKTSTNISLTTMKLCYKNIIFEKELKDTEPYQNQPKPQKFLYSAILPKILTKIKTMTTVASTNYDLAAIDNVSKEDGELLWIGFNTSTAAQYDTNKDPFVTENIINLEMFQSTTSIYKHETAREAEFLHLNAFKTINKFPLTSTYFYNIPFSSQYNWLPNSKLSKGINCNKANLSICFDGVTSATIQYTIFAVYRYLITIDGKKKCKHVSKI